MNAIVIYKSKYGSTKAYAEWIAQELSCDAIENKNLKVEDILKYDTIVYGGGLYAETIAGVSLITKNFEKLKDKKIIVYTTGITPIECREYYDKLVAEKNFKNDTLDKIKVYNFLGKMLMDELSIVHRNALKALKKIMQNKQNPSEMEKLLVNLCDVDADMTDRNAIKDLVDYAKE